MSSKHPHDYDLRLSGPGNNTRSRRRTRFDGQTMAPIIWHAIEKFWDIRDCAVARQLFPLMLWNRGVVWWIQELVTRSMTIPYSEAEFRFMRQYTCPDFWRPRLSAIVQWDSRLKAYHNSPVLISLAHWTLVPEFMKSTSLVHGNEEPKRLVKAMVAGASMGKTPPNIHTIVHMGEGYTDIALALAYHADRGQVIVSLAEAKLWFWLTQVFRLFFASLPQQIRRPTWLWSVRYKEAFFSLVRQKQRHALKLFVDELGRYCPGRLVRWCGLSHSLDTLKLSRQLAAGWRYTIRCTRWRSAHEDTTMWDTHWTHPSHINFFNQMRIYQQRIRDQRTRAAKRKRQQVQETTDKRSRLNENVAVAQG
jgi:hypothetical protein